MIENDDIISFFHFIVNQDLLTSFTKSLDDFSRLRAGPSAHSAGKSAARTSRGSANFPRGAIRDEDSWLGALGFRQWLHTRERESDSESSLG